MAVLLYVGALATLLGIQHHLGINITGVSDSPQFLYQAQSLLHGRWDLALPGTFPDVEVVHGKGYIYYPPFPAILMMPFVAIFGLRTSDVLFTVAVSASILSLLYLLFEQVRLMGLTRRTWIENAVLSALCYFGSILLALSLGGRLWFTTHAVAVATVTLSLLLAFRRQYAWAAVSLGAAFFTRFSLALGFPLLFYLAWQDVGADPLLGRFLASLRSLRPDWSAFPRRRLLPPAAIACGVVILFFTRNTIIFGSPLDVGYTTLLAQHYTGDMAKDGVFNLNYVKSNIASFFLAMPRVIWPDGRWDRHPVIDMLNYQIAVGVFFTTPLFLLLFWRNRQFSWLRAALWATIGLIVVSLLPFYANGSFQFGARYLTDAYPYAFLLLALTDMRLDWRSVGLGLLGIVINYLGAAQFWSGLLFRL